MYKILVNNKIVQNVANINWSDDLDNISVAFDFECDSKLDVGALFELQDSIENTTVIKGIIVDLERTDITTKYKYYGFDFGFYLGKNSIIKQFRYAQITDAITQLLKEYEIPIGNIPKLTGTVNDIYRNKSLGEVLKDLLELAKIKSGINDIYIDVRNGKFNIYSFTLNKELKGYMSEIFSIDSANTIHSPSIKTSMAELKNRVILANGNEKSLKIVSAKDKESAQKYGLLTYVEDIDTNNHNNLIKLASAKLKELNTISTTISLTMLGNHKMRKGIILPINAEELGLNGKFLIKSSSHDISSGKEIVTVDLIKRNT